MIETENGLNNFQCIFNISELNALNYSKFTANNLFEQILYTKENLDIFDSNFDNLLQKHTELKHYCRELGVNYIQNKIFIAVARREILLCGYLVKFLYSKELNQTYNVEGNDRIQQETNYFISLISKEFPDDKDLVFNTLMKECANFLKVEIKDTVEDIEEKEQMKEYLRVYSEKEQNFIKNNNEDHKPSIRMLTYFFTQFNLILENSIYKIKYLENMKSLITLKEKSEQRMLIELLKNNSKIGMLNDVLFNVFAKNNNDLFEKDANHDDWKIILPHYKFYLVESKNKLEKEIEKIFDLIMIGNASVNKSFNKEKDKIKLLKSGFYMAYFSMFKDKAMHTYHQFSIQPSFRVGRQVWNMLDTDGIKTFSKLGYPMISIRNKHKLNICYYEYSVADLKLLLEYFICYEKEKSNKEIKKLIMISKNSKNDKESNIDNIDNMNNIEKINFNEHNSENSNEKTHKTIKTMSSNDSINYKVDTSNNLNSNDDESFNPESSFKGPRIRIDKIIKLKILSSGKNDLHVPFELLGKKCAMNCCCSNNTYQLKSSKPGNLIIHIHGGGFVAMSSSSHENYLRKWANTLNAPIFSIDYSLAPESQFPVALNEIYQAYLWIIEKSGVKAGKIVLAGDSAGGNLVLALSCLLIVTNKRLPDFLVLAYPAVHLSMNSFSPSTLVALDDVVLPYALLKFSLDAYLGDVDGDNNFFASPGLMFDEVIKYLPKTYFYLGSNDPLRDQSFRLASRLM